MYDEDDVERMTQELDVGSVFDQLEIIEATEPNAIKRQKQRNLVIKQYKEDLKENISRKTTRSVRGKTRPLSDRQTESFAVGIMEMQGLLPRNIVRLFFTIRRKPTTRFYDIDRKRFVANPLK